MTDHLIRHQWWDPLRGPVTDKYDYPALEIRMRYDPEKQEHWHLEGELSRGVQHVLVDLRRIYLGTAADDEGRCQATANNGMSICVQYDTHLGDHRWMRRPRPIHDLSLPNDNVQENP